MILAAGRGERLKPLTNRTPKPLIKANGKPLIIWHLEHLVRANITEVIINCAWLSPILKSYLKTGEQWGVHIQYSEENTLLGTGGGIKKALPLLGSHEPFLLISSDISTDYPFSKLISKTLSSNQLGHVVLISNPVHHLEGDYGLDGMWIMPKKEGAPSFTFGSIALMTPHLFETIPDSVFPITQPFHQAIQKKQLSGEHFTGYHCNVDTLERLVQTEQDRKIGLINDNAS